MIEAAVTPHALEVEKALLGALLARGERVLDVAHQLAAKDFFRLEHQTIYATLLEMAKAGQHIDDLTVRERLGQQGHLEQIGGPVYLFGLSDGMPRSFNVEAYAAIVRDRADKAKLVAAAHKILLEAEQSQAPAREQLDHAERVIFSISQHDTRGDFIDAPTLVARNFDMVSQLLEQKHGTTGVRTGFVDFDTMTRGLQPGALVLLAARPSMGKTAFALQAAYQVAEQGVQVGFCSLEMSEQELVMRLVSAVGRVDGHRLQSGFVNQSDYSRISDAFSQIAGTQLYVDDTATLGILDVRGKARRLKAKHGLGLLVIDYLQLMQLGSAENRNLAVADASRSLKLLARELGIPVMALSQLSRDTERRGDKKPMLSDLRDSGALEQDADLVVFIHRPEVYQQTPENQGLAEIIIAKQRNGPTGTINLRWFKAETRFDNWSSR